MYRFKTGILIGFNTLVMIVFLTMPLFAVSQYRNSALNGGEQIWWEAEDFDKIAADGTMKLKADSIVQPPLSGAFGDDYIVHQGIADVPANMDTAFVEYQLGFVSKGGTWFMWMRESHDRRAGADGRLQNSCWIQVNSVPDNPAGFDNAKHRIGQTTGFPSVPDLWVWAGYSETGAGAEQGRLNGLLITLKGDGKDVIRVYSREGRSEPSTWAHDVLMISTVDFVPKDDNYLTAESGVPVQPAGKLPMIWGRIKDAR